LPPFYLGIFVLSLLGSFVLTRWVRDFATQKGWVTTLATAGQGRHVHSQALPRLGGVAIYLSFLVSIALAVYFSRSHPGLDFGMSLRVGLTIMLPGTLIFLLGVYDDLHPVGVRVKFAVQALAALMLFAGGLRIVDLPLIFGSRQLSWVVGVPLTVGWVIGITNAFNLIDGLDGLAAGSALFSTFVLFVVSLLNHSSAVALMSLVLAGAILGFLRFNFNPATIFLGDCGSLFIGFMLSALALQGTQKAPTAIAVAIPIVSFGLPILETLLSIIRRFISGRPVFTADREHIHHKLLQLGFSHKQVVITLYGVSALFALLSLFLLAPNGSTMGLVFAVLGTGVWVGVQHLGYLEFGELRRIALRTIDQRQVMINNMAVRRAIEELKAAHDYRTLGNILSAAFGSNDFEVFELRLNQGVALLPAGSLQVVSSAEEPPYFRWTKPGSRYRPGGISAWSMHLELITSEQHAAGSMVLQRLYHERELQLDINLLTTDFPVVLGDALLRIAKSHAAVPSRIEQAAVMAATAG
jgi:UDP-GlcNAc:undecaprenyl-phosphate GlcNAc-1-phosphate transferase